MRKLTRLTLALCAVVTSFAVAGCATEPDPVDTPEDVESWSAEDEAQAAQDAEQALRDYYRVSAECLADPQNVDATCFDQVAMNTALSHLQSALNTSQTLDLHGVGKIELLSVEQVEVQGSRGIDTVRLFTCIDRSDADTLRSDGVRADGTTEKPADWYPHIYDTVVVIKHAGVWKVAEFPEEEVVPC